jgi:hypothetical protein
MALSMLVYGIVWMRLTKRNAAKERERVAAFREKGGLGSIGEGKRYADGVAENEKASSGGASEEKKENTAQDVVAPA